MGDIKKEKTKADIQKKVDEFVNTLSQWLKSDEVTDEAKNYIRKIIYKLYSGP